MNGNEPAMGIMAMSPDGSVKLYAITRDPKRLETKESKITFNFTHVFKEDKVAIKPVKVKVVDLGVKDGGIFGDNRAQILFKVLQHITISYKQRDQNSDNKRTSCSKATNRFYRKCPFL